MWSIFNAFPSNRRLKAKWKKFHEAFTFELTNFEEKNVIPTVQKDFSELIRLLGNISLLKNSFCENEWKGITDFIDAIEANQGELPQNLVDLERYNEKIKERCSQIKYLIEKIQTRIDPYSISAEGGYLISGIISLMERIQRNINTWHVERSKLNNLVFSLLLEERKISYSNRVLLMEFFAVLIGVLFAVKIF